MAEILSEWHRPEAEVVDATDRIRDFILARVEPHEAVFLPGKVADIAREQVRIHLPSKGRESWYWHERVCQHCRYSWHKWLPGRMPTDIGPEQGCPTLRMWASLWSDHPDFDQYWRYDHA